MLDQLPPVLRNQIDVLLPQIMEGGSISSRPS